MTLFSPRQSLAALVNSISSRLCLKLATKCCPHFWMPNLRAGGSLAPLGVHWRVCHAWGKWLGSPCAHHEWHQVPLSQLFSTGWTNILASHRVCVWAPSAGRGLIWSFSCIGRPLQGPQRGQAALLPSLALVLSCSILPAE